MFSLILSGGSLGKVFKKKLRIDSEDFNCLGTGLFLSSCRWLKIKTEGQIDLAAEEAFEFQVSERGAGPEQAPHSRVIHEIFNHRSDII